MGMYDILGNEDGQVKCFDVVCYYTPPYTKENWKPGVHIGYMGGLLRYFAKGDEVPTRTWWYHYPDSFLIVDVNEYYHSESCVYKILDKKYVETYMLNELPENLFDGIQGAIDRYGDPLAIDSIASLLEYQNDYFHYCDTEDEILQRYSCSFEKAQEDFKKFLSKMDERDAMLKENTEKFRIKWKPKRSDDTLALYGAYLDEIIRTSERKDNHSEYERRYFNLLSEFSWYSREHNIHLDDFLLWHPDECNRERIKEAYNVFLSDCKARNISTWIRAEEN